MTEGPYKLPEGWRWVRLGEVCEVWDALRKPVKKKDRRLGDVPYCGANGIIDYVDGYTHVGEFVLLAEDGGFYGPGEPSAYMMNGRFWANNHVHVLRGKSGYLVNQFLYYWLVFCDLRPFLTGTTRPKLTQTAMHSIPIPLPPLEEQRRIVARVEELMSRIREAKRLRQEAKEEAERFWQSILSETFPKPGTELPEGWRWVKLREVCTLIESGFAFRKKGAPEGDLLHLRPYNIAEDGTLDLSQRFYVPSSLRSARHKFLQPGDVLFNNTNSVELIGKTALVREPLEAAFSNHITLLRPDTTKAEGAWIALVLLALWRQGFFANLCNKWIGQAGINTETLRSVLIPLPPLEEQRRIVAYFQDVQEKIRALKEAQAQTETELKRLEQAILDKAFRGEH
jgi:type I restriction enzyme S subunit